MSIINISSSIIFLYIQFHNINHLFFNILLVVVIMAFHPFIIGLTSTQLSQEERDFMGEYLPFGVILFSRNIESQAGLSALCQAINDCYPNEYKPEILIDQEGGRVQRLKPPLFKGWPAAGHFATLYQQDQEGAKQACYQSNLEMAKTLKACGITMNCTPVVDLHIEGANEVIGDRAYGQTPEQIADLASMVIKAHAKAGVKTIIKHMPGHGRAMQDSHEACPHISTPLDKLQQQDFACFKQLLQKTTKTESGFAMTAHIIYEAIDADHPATCSPKLIGEIIRGMIGFNGLLMSDDLCMHALQGNMETRARRALNAGCDVVMHCNGNMEEMRKIANIFK